MKRLLPILLVAVFLAGCGETLKSSWTNFTAYYNTFYNAKEYYRDGLSKVNQQPVEIDPSEPVRIHPAPSRAGYSDFQQAIEKGARVLRRFPDSKWVDDAILLIGKSYYYRQEFYSALEKFEELQNAATSPKMTSLAIIWKGRTQLDLQQYTTAINFLESELDALPDDWPDTYRGEIQAVLAQHHARMEHWGTAANYLYKAGSQIDEKPLAGKTYFLLGQVLEHQERYGEAFNAFGEVEKNFPNFEYLYWAQFKQADIARKSGRYDLALDIFDALRKDDKNDDRRGRLTYEVAYTYELMGRFAEAERLFRQVLDSPEYQQQGRSLKADVYFRLGKIYGNYYEKYSRAAAYYDSASALKTAARQQEEESAEALADIYGKYTELQEDIRRADSLLYLGSLSAGALDSALSKVRQQKIEQLEAAADAEASALLNQQDDVKEVSDPSSEYGYLNYKDAALVDRSKAQFSAVWGNRPLVDNWRREEAIRSVSNRQTTFDDRENQEEGIDEDIILDVGAIPRNDEQKEQLALEKAEAQYQLGSLLFLNLNLPDSARYYFHRVIHNNAAEPLYPQTMYSLVEIFSAVNNADSLKYWGDAILNRYPETRYARSIRNRRDGTSAQPEVPDSENELQNRFYEYIGDSTAVKPFRLRKLALENRDAAMAPYIFYRAIEEYIREAKKAEDIMKKDIPVLTDSLSAADSLQSLSTLEDRQKYRGQAWDSVRFAIQQFDTTFPKAPQKQRVQKMKQLLQESKIDSVSGASCEQKGVELEVDPAMEDFLSKVSFSEKIKGMTISGRITYEFTVNREGEVVSYTLLTEKTSLGIEEAYEEAFDKYLQFKPLDYVGDESEIICRMSFPVQHR